jgi:tRNA (cytidine/uridine-2'-O-)-methyltransferase
VTQPASYRIVLVEPEIPPNTGNVIRLAANTGCELHLIEPLGFSMDHKQLRRAGLDYHEFADVRCHASWSEWIERCRPVPDRVFAFTTRGERLLTDAAFAPGDWLVFGSESRGLPAPVRESLPRPQQLRLPMRPRQRSLNLSNAVAIAVYEAWRQQGFVGTV